MTVAVVLMDDAADDMILLLFTHFVAQLIVQADESQYSVEGVIIV